MKQTFKTVYKFKINDLLNLKQNNNKSKDETNV